MHIRALQHGHRCTRERRALEEFTSGDRVSDLR
jgi:hypothetical protein